MDYRPLLLTLVTFSTLAMDDIKLVPRRQPVDIQDAEETPTKTITISESGGVQSLVSATKGGQEIIIIGHTRVKTWRLVPYSFGDDQAKRMLFPQLDSWSLAQEPIVFISLDSQQTCAQHAEQLAKPQKFLASHKPLHAIINGVAHEKEFQYGVLKMVCLPDHGPETLTWDPTILFGPEFFPELAEKSQLAIDEKTQNVVSEASIIESKLSTIPVPLQKIFLSREGGFNCFIKQGKEALRAHSSLITLKEYYTQLETCIDYTDKLGQLTQYPEVKELAARVHHRLRHTRHNVGSFLALYGATEATTLFEALCTIIKTSRQFTSSTRAFFKELIVPLLAFQRLIILEELLGHKRVVILLPYDQVAQLSFTLEKAGYTVTRKGNLPLAHEDYTLGKSPFTHDEIQAFLTARFGVEAQLEAQEELPESPFAKYIAQQTMGEELQQLAQAVNNKKKPYQANQPGMAICSYCKQKTTRDTMYVSNKKSKKGLCSLPCLTNFIMNQKAGKIKKLLGNSAAQTVLSRMAALCYLKYLSLCPMITINEGAFFSLNLKPLPPLLQKITQDTQDPTWQKALSLLKPLCVSPDQLSSFIEQYLSLKEKYTQERKAYTKAKRKATHEILLPSDSTFDTEDTLETYLTDQHKLLAEKLGMPRIPPLCYGRIYYTLSQLLHKKPLTLSAIINLLK